MDPVDNPYRPGAGRRPAELAGRSDILDGFSVVRRRVSTYAEGDRSWILNGLRGVGKTVLLGELQRLASDDHWIVVKVEVTAATPLPIALASGLVKAMRTATGRHPERPLRRLLAVFKAFSATVDPASGLVTLGVEVDAERGHADSGRFGDDLADLFEVLGETSAELGIGTLVLIDELQEASAAELSAVNTAVHRIDQGATPLPVIVVGAGLPSLPAQLADATSYAERLYDYRQVGLLDEDSSREALSGPALQRGVAWRDDALDAALEVAGGYPYFLQSVGKHVWDAAARSPISIDDVEAGSRYAKDEVDQGLYLSRWERATTAQRGLLRAMSECGGDLPSGISDLVDAMGKRRPSDLSVSRDALIKKGLVYAPERGLLAFTVPGMAEFVRRRP